MSENKMSDIIKASLEGIRSFTDMDTVIGGAINTPSGVTVIPVSKISMGIATGGVDYGTKKHTDQNFGGGGGTGLTVNPVGFLVVDADGDVEFIPVSQKGKPDPVDQIADLVERTPDIIAKIKDIFAKDSAAQG